jgi:hypothetical protein
MRLTGKSMWYVATTNVANEQHNKSWYLDVELALDRVKELALSGYRVIIEEEINHVEY